MHEFIIRAIEQGGYLGIFVLMALENIFPPIPSEVIMGIGGVAVARGAMALWPLRLAGTLGSTLGNYAWYWVGDAWGYQRLAPFVDRHGRWLTMEWQDVEAAQSFFRKHGPWVVFLLRFTPFFRTMISLPAGLAHMGKVRFLVFTIAGVAIWNLLLVEGGRRLSLWLDESQAVLGWIILGLIGLTLVAYVWRVITWKPRAERG
jgi:membrane protein DedA with SNARE-associated domain